MTFPRLLATTALLLPLLAAAQSSAGPHVSVSIGACTLAVSADDQIGTLIGQADQALYHAKRHGRARLFHYSQL